MLCTCRCLSSIIFIGQYSTLYVLWPSVTCGLCQTDCICHQTFPIVAFFILNIMKDGVSLSRWVKYRWNVQIHMLPMFIRHKGRKYVKYTQGDRQKQVTLAVSNKSIDTQETYIRHYHWKHITLKTRMEFTQSTS